MSATMARSTSLTQKRASCAHTRTSHATARSTPPPKHAPWIAHTTGARHRSTAVKLSCRRRTWLYSAPPRDPRTHVARRAIVCPSCSSRSSGEETSMPAQKFFPGGAQHHRAHPVVRSSHARARGISHMSGSMALDFRGGSDAGCPRPSSTSTTTVLKLGGGGRHRERAPRGRSRGVPSSTKRAVTRKDGGSRRQTRQTRPHDRDLTSFRGKSRRGRASEARRRLTVDHFLTPDYPRLTWRDGDHLDDGVLGARRVARHRARCASPRACLAGHSRSSFPGARRRPRAMFRPLRRSAR